MSFIANDIELSQKLTGKVIESAASNLTSFAVKFEDGSGLLLQVAGAPGEAKITSTLMPASELPSIGDAVCKVEWAWIVSSKVVSINTVTGSFEFHLEPAGKLTILAQVYQGSLFLSFMPYKGS